MKLEELSFLERSDESMNFRERLNLFGLQVVPQPEKQQAVILRGPTFSLREVQFHPVMVHSIYWTVNGAEIVDQESLQGESWLKFAYKTYDVRKNIYTELIYCFKT